MFLFFHNSHKSIFLLSHAILQILSDGHHVAKLAVTGLCYYCVKCDAVFCFAFVTLLNPEYSKLHLFGGNRCQKHS